MAGRDGLVVDTGIPLWKQSGKDMGKRRALFVFRDFGVDRQEKEDEEDSDFEDSDSDSSMKENPFPPPTEQIVQLGKRKRKLRAPPNPPCPWQQPPSEAIRLPNEVLEMIFSYHSHFQLWRNSQVCQQWRDVAFFPQLWTRLTFTLTEGKRWRFMRFFRTIVTRFGDVVESINTAGMQDGLPAQAFDQIGKHCSMLQYLNVKARSNGLNPASLGQLAQRNLHLRWLNASGSQNLTLNCISQMLETLPGLTHLMLHHCQLRSGSLRAVAEHGRSLKMLRMNNNEGISSSYQHIVSHMNELEFLDLSYTDVGDREIIDIIQTTPKLRTLILHHCAGISGEFLHELAHHTPHLVGLDISSCPQLQSLSILALGRCPQLRHLDLSNCKSIIEEHLEAIIRAFVSRGILETFWFTGTLIGSTGYEELLHLDSLQKPLDTSSCRGLSRSQRIRSRDEMGEIPKRDLFISPPPPFEFIPQEDLEAPVVE